jgi:hypothetical protein
VVADRFTVNSGVQESSPIRETRNEMLNTREIKRSIPFGLESLGSDILTTIPQGINAAPKAPQKRNYDAAKLQDMERRST